jgi:exodeoxyribonuclease III
MAKASKTTGKRAAKSGPKLRIASWNINSVRARMELVEQFIAAYNPDILCLQEIKAQMADFPTGRLRALGYRSQAIHGQKMHHGVAILSKIELTGETKHDWQGNGEARHVGATLAGANLGDTPVRLENIYAPAGGEEPDETPGSKFLQKLDYFDRLTAWAQSVQHPTIIVGDLNIAPLPEDVWSHKDLVKVVSHTPIEIEKMAALYATQNFIDVGRHVAPAPKRLYTWWSYRAADWKASDRGRRLDHILVSPSLETRILDCFVAEDARSWAKPSDHAPVIADFSLS